MVGAGDAGRLSPWIRDQLLVLGGQRAAELRSGARRLADDEQADALLRQDPFAALTGILCQQWRTRAGRAWEVPWRARRVLGHLGPRLIARNTATARRELLAGKAARPRTIEIIVRAAERVTDAYHGDASAIWAGATSAGITEQVRQFHGAGPKISQMAPAILAAAFALPVRLDGPIAVDSNVPGLPPPRTRWRRRRAA